MRSTKVSDPNGEAPDSPETGEPDTESLNGTDFSTGNPGDDDVAELGAEDDLRSGSTGALPEGLTDPGEREVAPVAARRR